MAAIDELIQQIQDPILRERIRAEVEDLSKQKKFGLVFENHLPEHTPLYEMPIKVGSLVMPKLKKGDELFTVNAINGDNAIVVSKSSGEESELPLRSLVVAAELGEPIYPHLKYVDSISRAPGDDLWHVLIEADNYHALQLLEYLYAGKVDCIYIDPPYNTGARDWKYNNDYVDGNDSYRHSKWLSMMEKRLRIAKKLLNPAGSSLIVAIDEKEYLHLGCLLEDLFPEARMQMVSTIIKPEGTNRVNEFSRTNEFLFFLMFGDVSLTPSNSTMFDYDEKVTLDIPESIEWRNLRRRENTSVRSARPNQFYPFFINATTGFIEAIGEALPYDVDRHSVPVPEGCYALFPLKPNGEETLWGKHYQTSRQLLAEGYLKVENGTDPKRAIIKYLPSGTVDDIHAGKIEITGRGDQNDVIGQYKLGGKEVMPKTVWYLPSHNSQTSGSLLLKKVIGDNRFSFPKSLYAVEDCIRFFVAKKKDALVLDFFAGSGTTLHAVNLLNLEDGGKRRCIIVTNNEVSEEESKRLQKEGFWPGDEQWDKYGIARYVTWPRIVCSITGKTSAGDPIKGDYISPNRPMELGFASNAIFFKLGFLDKTSVALGRQFRELLPLIWMKSGCYERCPVLPTEEKVPSMLIFPENRFAVLVEETFFDQFEAEIKRHPEIESVFIVTNSDIGYREMSLAFEGKETYQLYRDYLDNFRLNVRK